MTHNNLIKTRKETHGAFFSNGVMLPEINP